MSNSTVGIEEERLQKIEELFVKQKKFSRVLRTSTASDRINKLKKLKKWITDHLEEIQKAVYLDFKKPPAEVDLTESYVVVNEINHSIKNLKDWMKPESIPTPLLLLPSTGKLVYEPKGSCLIISPWNFPFNLAIGPLVSAIAAGNTVILKPSEISPNTSALISSMISELFQENEVAAIQGGIEASQHLLSLPFDHIFFTGSTEVGKVVMRAAADNLASVTLELGGKSPAIIHSDADVKDAARKLAWANLSIMVKPVSLLIM